GNVAPRSGDAGDKPVGAVAREDDNRNGAGRAPRSIDCLRPAGRYNVDFPVDEIGGHLSEIFRLFGFADFDVNSFSFDIAKLSQSVQKRRPQGVHGRIVAGAHSGQIANLRHTLRLFRLRCGGNGDAADYEEREHYWSAHGDFSEWAKHSS